jgi:transposase InsO family protein
MRLVHQALLREWPRLKTSGENENAAPSYAALRGYLRALPRPLAIIARDGERAFTEKCQPYLLTDFNALRPNQIWVSDHCKHDVWTRNDCLPGAPRDSAIRLWLTAILDMRSRKLVGFVWCATPSSHSISSALRAAITTYGIPETFYIDNGKDYEKVGKVGLSDDASGVLARLGIQPQFCLPKHPQSKLIESFFATLHKRFDALWRPFYCGSSPQTRPEDCNAALKQHQLWLNAKAASSPLPLASEFMETARAWLAEHNAHHEHSGRGMDGRSPDEVYEELLPAAQRKAPEDIRALDSLFWDRQRRTVSEGGCVQLYNERYEPDGQAGFARLFLEIGREILVACDPSNLGEALALDLDGRWIANLKAQKLLERGPVSHDDIRESMRLRTKVRRICTEYIQHIGGAAGESEVAGLRRRAGLPLQLEAGEVPMAERLPAAVGQSSTPYIDDIADRFLESNREEGND